MNDWNSGKYHTFVHVLVRILITVSLRAPFIKLEKVNFCSKYR